MMTPEENEEIWKVILEKALKDNKNRFDMEFYSNWMATSWSPKLPAGNQDTFGDWMTTDNSDARSFSTKCECGVDVTYKGMEGTEYWHSHWCPKYKEKPKEEKK